MDLQKRYCPIQIHLTPTEAYSLVVDIVINGEKRRIIPSAAMFGSMFDGFLSAVYLLYTEGKDCHNSGKLQTVTRDIDNDIISSKLEWDDGGTIITIRFSREYHSKCFETKDADPVKMSITYEVDDNLFETSQYTVEGRDLCYAVAKACTEMLMTYGIRGYTYSTGDDTVADDMFDLDHLLFVKAYALNVPEVRKMERKENGLASDIDKEIELLMFDM